ncbi:MAG TPA: baseplate J/gp47 family protein [Polyangia bacterium]|nr:baseplate J/gp47 family protein [Polyangia bacterium]
MPVAPYINGTDTTLPAFVAVGLQGWVDTVTALFQSIYGTDKDFTPGSKDGQLIAGLAAIVDHVEQLTKQVYEARSPAGAVGVGLSRLVGLNGITRKPAQASTAPVTLGGATGTFIPGGSLVGSNLDPSKPSFTTTTDLTIGGGGTVDGIVQCTQPGPVPARLGELSVMQTSITGWTSVTNTAAATPGMNVEADPALRVRRAGSVALPSQSMLDGFQAALQALKVTDARVYENTSGVTDEKGLPPHSFQAIIQNAAATDAEIANIIWLKAGMGATKVGAHSATVTDANGNAQTMRWDWATTVNAYVVVKLDRAVSNLAYLNNQIGDAIANYFSPGGDLPALIGQNIAWFDLATPINALGLTGRPGLPNVSAVYLGSSPSPTTQADLVVPYNAIALFDKTRVSVING